MTDTTRVLRHESVTAGGNDQPTQWLYVLHGIYGAGRNWASVIRRIVRARPGWGALLIDLRQHGGSQGFPPPHTVEAAAGDIVVLAEHTGLPPTAILGHSFGGKVALLFAGLQDSDALEALRQVWVIDSTPEPREPGGSAWTMLNLLRSMPATFATRGELVDALVSHNMSAPVAQWMATNLEKQDAGYRWRFDLDALEALLLSFFETSAWDIVETPPPGVEVHLVKAAESSVLEGAALRRCEAAADTGPTFVHHIEGGHWVNAENPAAIEELLVQWLPADV
ncbi:alpha/beta fold hydrolase [soil metagenome]